MNTSELIIYVQAQTGRKLHNTQLSLYIKKGWLTSEPQRWDGVDYFENHYTVEAADDFVRHLTSLTLTGAASHMTERLGWLVTTGRILELCEQDKVICISDPYRIPLDALHILEEQLIESLGIPWNVADAMLATCLERSSITALAMTCEISVSMMSYIKSGKRRMSAEVYNKLLQLSQEGIQDE